MSTKALIDMKPGETGMIVELAGGRGCVQQLGNLGLIVGKEICKVGAHLWRGPQIVRLGQQQIVVGHGVAQKILVETKE
jgi:ferrous iron transport protein A